jgi:hypothetical protein
MPLPIFVLPEPFPRMRSHILSVRSFPTLSATFIDGCTATLLTLPLCPFKLRNKDQSRARNRQIVPSSEALTRCERVAKLRCVMEPR